MFDDLPGFSCIPNAAGYTAHSHDGGRYAARGWFVFAWREFKLQHFAFYLGLIHYISGSDGLDYTDQMTYFSPAIYSSYLSSILNMYFSFIVGEPGENT